MGLEHVWQQKPADKLLTVDELGEEPKLVHNKAKWPHL